MKRILLGLLLSPFLLAAGWAQEPELVSESWHLILIQDQPMGYGHQSLLRQEVDGEPRFTQEQVAEFRIGRLGSAVEITVRMSVVEDRVGQILSAESEMVMAKNPTRFRGVVADGYLRGSTELLGRETPVELEWEDGVLSARGIEELTLLLIGEGEGATASARTFDPTTQSIQTVELEVGPAEELELGGETLPCTLVWTENDMMPGVRSRSWVDGQGRLLKSATMVAGGIEMVTLLSTRELALASLLADQPVHDLFAATVVQSNRRIARPRQVDGALFRLKLRDPDLGFPDPGVDRRQQVLEESEGEILLRISRVEPPAPMSLPMLDLPEEAAAALVPAAMIQSDDPALVAAAREVVGAETDAWTAAKMLERWVYDHIDKKGMDVALASAAEVFEERSGDCSEHAVLLAGMCRAAGIPARVVMGFEYFAGIFGGHAWTEVWVGDWCALDATNGFGWVDATHIAFLNGAFDDDDAGSNGFVSLGRIFGNLDIEVLELSYGDRVVDVTRNEAVPAVVEGRYVDPLLGFSFEVPAGWDVELGDPRGMSSEVAEIEAPQGPDQIELSVQSVPYSFTLAELVAQVRDEGDPPPAWTEVARHPAVRFEDPRGEGKGKTLVVFLDGDTMIGFDLRWSSEASRRALDRLLETVVTGSAPAGG